jgi:mannose-6-phosphate isomerase-like protein (cupin superfamily)
VVEGQASFTIGDESHSGGPGTVAWAPADLSHGVTNIGSIRLVMLIGMAPEPG